MDTKTITKQKVYGWPDYVAMGAVGGPNTQLSKQIYKGGDDSFGGKPVDAVFKYAGVNGNGDPGVIDPPMNVIRMTNDLNLVSKANNHPTRVVMVEYTAQMSGGKNYDDFTNTASPNPHKQNATYLMARHFASLIADAMALQHYPVVYNNEKYHGSLILNPDLLGMIQQQNYIDDLNELLSDGRVNTAVDQALSLMTNERSYTNRDKNSQYTPAYNKSYTGTPFEILAQMLEDQFPEWIINSQSDQYWGVAINNKGSQLEEWFQACVSNPTYDKSKYNRPNFTANFDGWVQANNWLIRTFAPKNEGVTFGWQDNMWAVQDGFWVHQNLTDDQIAQQYSTPLTQWLEQNAPSAMNTTGDFSSDYFVFDRYETDDSTDPNQGTLYNARSWDNLITAVGQVSDYFNNIPIMLWQIPGSHLPYQGEEHPEYSRGIEGSYVFSTAPVYFFGDSKLKSDLSNLIQGPLTSINTAVGTYLMPQRYNGPAQCTYKVYLQYYQGKENNFDWSRDNEKLEFAAKNNIFAILWGGGTTTNVIKNFSNTDDHGWLAGKIRTYYQNPQALM